MLEKLKRMIWFRKKSTVKKMTCNEMDKALKIAVDKAETQASVRVNLARL